jgi:hypothetical protein
MWRDSAHREEESIIPLSGSSSMRQAIEAGMDNLLPVVVTPASKQAAWDVSSVERPRHQNDPHGVCPRWRRRTP